MFLAFRLIFGAPRQNIIALSGRLILYQEKSPFRLLFVFKAFLRDFSCHSSSAVVISSTS
jgi:hypothetical protein